MGAANDPLVEKLSDMLPGKSLMNQINVLVCILLYELFEEHAVVFASPESADPKIMHTTKERVLKVRFLLVRAVKHDEIARLVKRIPRRVQFAG